MKISVNPDRRIAEAIRQGLRDSNGYCPCSLEKTEDTKCICKEFREQNTTGYCHCNLYYKSEV